jgi:2-keto-4-pentenoate hydratase
MSEDPTLDTLLAAYRAGRALPAHLAGRITNDDAYAMQIRLLGRLRDAGAAHSGWKIGQTNTAMRAERGETQRALGYLLADGAGADGGTVDLDAPGEWFLEPELAFVLAADISGPGADEDTVAAAIATMHPAFELVCNTGLWSDRAAQRAVNANQAGYVLGAALPRNLDPDGIAALPVQVSCDDGEVAAVRCADVIDHPLTSTAWLANYLAARGERLTAGQVVLTGSFTPLLPMRRGQVWRAHIGDGSVTMSTA